MAANILEIGRELQAVKQRLEHGQFLNWVQAACMLSARSAQLMMKAAARAEGKDEIVAHLEPTAIYLLAAPSTPETVRQRVMSQLEAGQRPAPQVIKSMIRAAKYGTLTIENTGQIDNPVRRQGAQLAKTKPGTALEVQRVRSESVTLAQPQPVVMQLRADEADTEPLLPPHLRDLSPRTDRRIYPEIDPLSDREPPWINGALKLIPLLAEAVPLEGRLPNPEAIIDAALELIPALAEAVLDLQGIAKRQSIAALLRYCGYNDYAARISRCLLTEPVEGNSDDALQPASFRQPAAAATTGAIVTDTQLPEADNVTQA
jgi:hypothetical protein